MEYITAYIQTVIERIGFRVNGGYQPDYTGDYKIASFVVPAMPPVIRAGEVESLPHMFTSEFSREYGTREEDTLTWHDVRFESLSSDGRIPLTRVHVKYSIGFSERRKRICGFLEELNALQEKYGISMSQGPMVEVFPSKCAAPYSLMRDDGHSVVFSRPWGG